MKRCKLGKIQKKILLLLLGGLALGLSRSPRQYFKILKEISGDWKQIDNDSMNKALKPLSKKGYLKEKINGDGTVSICLSPRGEMVAKIFTLENVKIKKINKWDGNWRIVLFDIPEHLKKVRDAIRYHLKEIGFYEFQKSVFLIPYPCVNEIELITNFYNAKKFVRIIIAHSIDNENRLIKKFGLQYSKTFIT